MQQLRIELQPFPNPTAHPHVWDVSSLDKVRERSRIKLSMPKWRNWQTRQLQELVSVKEVEVRVLSSALKFTTSNGLLPPLTYVLNRKWQMSPSCMTYVLPSTRNLPA